MEQYYCIPTFILGIGCVSAGLVAESAVKAGYVNNISCAIRSCLVLLCTISLLFAQSNGGVQPAGESLLPDPGWPRQYTDGTAVLILYQPEVDRWRDFRRLTRRFAAALTPRKGAQTLYGVVSVESDTRVDLETRTVGFENFAVTDVRYPAARNDADAQYWVTLTTKLFPAYPTTEALDRILAYLDDNPVDARQTAVLLDPPPIIVTKQPAVLVIIDGQPIPVDIEGTNLQKVVNTNWDLLIDKGTGSYYLRHDKAWLSARGLNEAWTSATKLPRDFSSLPATDEYKEMREAAAAPKRPAFVTLVLVVQKPSELIVLDGEPRFRPIAGTQLMWVVNTECDLFFDKASNSFYFLTSGRWFWASELRSNEWKTATASLPDDFKKIPKDHPRAHVLASVPGTRQAEDAVLAASIPQTATINRSAAKAEVQYIGEPKFEPISGTAVWYATNTPNDVLKLGDSYYLCLDGVWFLSTGATGPWEPADKIPVEIKTFLPVHRNTTSRTSWFTTRHRLP